jgi:hypothetical protein
MANKIGVNDPCPCGSGLKYKKCCGKILPSNVIGVDFAWQKLRKTEGTVVDEHLLPYAFLWAPEAIMEKAFDDCCRGDFPEELDEELFYAYFFIPWMLFAWIPNDNFANVQFDPNMTIAQNYVKNYAAELNSFERKFITAMADTYYSFYNVLEVELEEKLVVKDILLGTTHTIKEHQATHTLKRGDVIFSRILTLDGQSIFVGMMPFNLPAHYNTDLIYFRKWLIEENGNNVLTGSLLHGRFAQNLLDKFFDTIDECFNKEPPILCNTDGELLQPTKVIFELKTSVEEALSKLMPLTLSKNVDDFLDDAKRDKKGVLKRVEIPWLKRGNKKHPEWDNTGMGYLTIQKGKIILETNSQSRAEKGKKLLNKYLGDAVCFQKIRVESLEKQLKKSMEQERLELEKDRQELLASPKLQVEMQRMVDAHWRNWFDQPIPALEDQTPRQAAKNQEGRELLEALLLQYERYDQENANNGNHNLLQVDIKYLRKELGLDG